MCTERKFLQIKVAILLLCISCSIEIKGRTINVNDDFLTNSHIFLNANNDTELETSKNYTLLDTLQITFRDFEDLVESLLLNLLANVPLISESTGKLLTELSLRIINGMEALSVKVLSFGNDTARAIVTSIREQLTQLKNEFEGITSHVDDRFFGAINYLNESLMNHTEDIDMWAANIKQELRSVNDSRIYREGCQIVDDFIVESTNRLQSCCNIAIKPMTSVCASMGSIMAKAFRVLADAMDRMQACLEDKNSYLDYLIPCLNLAYDDISALVLEAAQLRHKINLILPMKVFYSRYCISFVLVEIQQGQDELESDLSQRNNMNF